MLLEEFPIQNLWRRNSLQYLPNIGLTCVASGQPLFNNQSEEVKEDKNAVFAQKHPH